MKRKLQVFVSSTFSDLIPERQAAVSAILKAGHIPAGMELFTAGDKSQLDTIKRWIDESDVYMLILGGRYGSVEPISGVSYTELEYDYATEQEKPLFAVVIKSETLEEKVRTGGGISLLEMDKPTQLKQFREKVLSKVSSFFGSESDIKLCVHESLSDFRDNADLKGWVSASDVEDTKPLHDEISSLRSEVTRLQNELKSAPSRIALPQKPNQNDYQREIDALIAVMVNVPEAAGGPSEISLLELFVSYKDQLINGITNSFGISAVSSFLYHNIAPKLIVHGLMENEKVAGVQYRRSFVTPKGLAILAEIDRRLSILAKEKKPKLNEENSAAKSEA